MCPVLVLASFPFQVLIICSMQNWSILHLNGLGRKLVCIRISTPVDARGGDSSQKVERPN